MLSIINQEVGQRTHSGSLCETVAQGKDAKARASSSEMHFDGVKFFFTSVADDALLGKAGEYACAFKATAQTIVIVITKGTPQAVLGHLAPVVKAVKDSGM